MLKKLFLLIGLIIFNSPNYAKPVLSACDFKTGDYIDQLDNPNSIKNLDIKVAKSKKYITNFLKTLLSTQESSRSINPKFKKKFNANIVINYNFGTCSYTGQIWQNGDWLDHLSFKNGKPVRSLNVKMNDGNLLNATKFKLLLPETRNGKNEILAALISRNLGFIAPETFEIEVSVNSAKHRMLFQEDSQKELLERNSRREGPIFEGDETLLWGKDNFELFGNVGGGGLETISLSRLINNNWFIKGKSSQFITLKAYSELQDAYLDYSNNYIQTSYYLKPNKITNDKFTDFNFLMLALNGTHALRPHNRKYYFNSFTEQFEPIYYDGDVKMDRIIYDNKNIDRLNFSSNYNFPHSNKIINKKFLLDIKNQYKERVKNYNYLDDLFLANNFSIFKRNSNYIQSKIKDSSSEAINSNYKINREKFLNKNSEYNIENKIIKSFVINNDVVNLVLEDDQIEVIDKFEFARVLSRKKINGEKYLYLPEIKTLNNKDDLKQTNFEDIVIVHPKKVEIELINSKKNKKLMINSLEPNQSVLIKDSLLKNIEIIYNNGKSNSESEKLDQRFNKKGLTGCLNIYNSVLDQISIKVIGGECEDSLNIINSIGDISNINISNAYQDAIDLDFSNVKIKKIDIVNAGNDCFDVSGGTYFIGNGKFYKCKDKAISVGEKSRLEIDEIFIDYAKTGIAVKDLSKLIARRSTINNSSVCVHAFQKKKEFGGASAKFENINCDGNYLEDNNSIILY